MGRDVKPFLGVFHNFLTGWWYGNGASKRDSFGCGRVSQATRGGIEQMMDRAGAGGAPALSERLSMRGESGGRELERALPFMGLTWIARRSIKARCGFFCVLRD
jgi:hypothetical protein